MADMSISDDESNARIWGQSAVQRAQTPVEQGAPAERPDFFSETLPAAFRQSNIVSSLYDRMINHPDSDVRNTPGYDALNDIHGYEDRAAQFFRSTSPEQTRVIKDRIDSENQDKQTISQAGAAGMATSMAAGALDPLTLTLIAIPGGGEAAAASKLARVGGAVATNVIAGEAQQAALTATQETTDYQDGIVPRIGANALLAGVLGGITIPRGELKPIADRVQTELNSVPSESTAGAAAVHTTTLEDESIARGGEWIAKTLGKISPITRLFTDAKVVESRQIAQQLVDVPFMLNKNFRNVATSENAEMVINQQQNVRNFQDVQALGQNFADYKKGGGQLALHDFMDEVATAVRNGGQHEIPQAATLAQHAAKWFDGDRTALGEVGGLKEGAETPIGAKGYWPRVWDQFAVKNNQTELENIFRDWYTRNPKTVPMEPVETKLQTFDQFTPAHVEPGTIKPSREVPDTLKPAKEVTTGDTIEPAQYLDGKLIKPAKAGHPIVEPAKIIPDRMVPGEITPAAHETITEARGPPKPIYREPAEVEQAVRDTIDHILGTVRGTADVGVGVKNPNILKARALDVPDEVINRGTKFLSNDFEHVMEAYHRTVLPQIEMRRRFGSTDLASQIKDIGDAYNRRIVAAGTDDEAKAKLTDQLAKDVQNIQLLRDRVLNQAGARNDTPLALVRTAQVLRTFNYMRMLGGQTLSALPDLGRLVSRYGLVNTGMRTAQLLSGLTGGLARADAQRMGTALDVVLHTRQHTLEGIGDEMSGSSYMMKALQNQSNLFTKISGIATWDAMMRTLSSQLEQDAIARMLSKEGGLSAIETAKMASHGIGENDVDAIRGQWAKYGSNEMGLNRARTELWDNQTAARKVEQAIQRAGSQNAFFVGKGDLPGFASSELGKIMIQFKGFALSSVNRLVIPLAQGIAHGDVKAANGMASMLALGALTYYTKELAAGRQPDLSPDNLIPEMVQRSGILTYVPDVYDPIAERLHLPRFSKFQDQDIADTLGGPTAGTLSILLKTIGSATSGEMSFKDIHKLRQLIPYQNLFYFNRIMNLVEGKTADALNVDKAPGVDASDYLNPSKDSPEPEPKADKKHFLGIQSIPNEF